MPRKSAVKSEGTSRRGFIGVRKIQKDDQWGGYVQCNISDFEREAFDLWLSENLSTVPALLTDILAVGLKLTAVYDGANECFIVTFTGRPDVLGESPFTTSLSGRGGSLDQAINVLVYKHIELTGGDWTEWLVNGAKSKRNFG